MIQLVSPNLGQTSLAGWCLWFARVAFGAPAVEASAWAGWLNTKYRHGDWNLPNVAVPVWFQSYGDYDGSGVVKNWGHVAIFVPGRGVLSSPITWNGPGQQWYNSISELAAAINRILPNSRTVYVGWSEDISNVRVAKEDNPMAIIENQPNWIGRANRSFNLIRGRGMGDGEMNPWVGQDFLHLIEALEDDAEADAWYANGVRGKQATAENWQGQITDLNAQLATSKAETAQAKISSGSFNASDRTMLKSASDGVAWLVAKITGIFK